MPLLCLFAAAAIHVHPPLAHSNTPPLFPSGLYFTVPSSLARTQLIALMVRVPPLVSLGGDGKNQGKGKRKGKGKGKGKGEPRPAPQSFQYTALTGLSLRKMFRDNTEAIRILQEAAKRATVQDPVINLEKENFTILTPIKNAMAKPFRAGSLMKHCGIPTIRKELVFSGEFLGKKYSGTRM